MVAQPQRPNIPAHSSNSWRGKHVLAEPHNRHAGAAAATRAERARRARRFLRRKLRLLFGD